MWIPPLIWSCGYNDTKLNLNKATITIISHFSIKMEVLGIYSTGQAKVGKQEQGEYSSAYKISSGAMYPANEALTSVFNAEHVRYKFQQTTF